jgi:stearoyl-CoA desaturase (delta-9 desaturase)
MSSILRKLVLWFDAGATAEAARASTKRVDWVRVAPFVGVHLMCFGVIWVGWSANLVALALGMYALRMFAITGFYHRYFSHRTFQTSRAAQFAFAVLGASAAQRGPLWWAAHHRKHHRHSDTELDVHSPKEHGFFWSHMGWITSPANFPTDFDEVRDLAKYPELRFLDRFDILVPVLFGYLLLRIGGWPFVIWGFFISTVVLFHCTCFINSLAHRIGTQRYDTHDESGNSFALAVITLGEGWHNNHHKYPGAARQGFFWWELDITYCGLVILQKLRIVRDLRPVPERLLRAT